MCGEGRGGLYDLISVNVNSETILKCFKVKNKRMYSRIYYSPIFMIILISISNKNIFSKDLLDSD